MKLMSHTKLTNERIQIYLDVFSEISIPPELINNDGSDYHENSAGAGTLMGIVEELDQTHVIATVGTTSSPTSMGQQSHGYMSTGGTMTTNTHDNYLSIYARCRAFRW